MPPTVYSPAMVYQPQPPQPQQATTTAIYQPSPGKLATGYLLPNLVFQ